MQRWLVVGLGNPEADYAGTRHNVGADTIRVLSGRVGRDLKRNRRARCLVAESDLADHRVAFAIPSSFMNESGAPVQRAASWFKVGPEHIIVIHDDLDIAFASLRIKRGGGNAGHRGLGDIDQRLGSSEYLRVRIGIGRPPGRMDPAAYVLRRFATKERDEIDITVEQAADAVESLLREGLEPTQQRFNG